ncbi:MAG: hypothetical protein J7K13_00550 [Thermoplasmata archaeon]|nr:hypothetical protein [Thermoplasmata archaeon]
MISKRKLYPKKRVHLKRPIRNYYISLDKGTSYRNIEQIPLKTFTFAAYALRWILLMVLVYIITSTTLMLFTQSYSFLQQIVTLSIGGFFGFFMGYFGWIFAHELTQWISGKKKDEFFDNLQF